uniref:Evasin n=1 Tax=Rhipicephalus microplus TaxID=6941 RepID=A0A6G5A1G0_RHIMP
MLGLMENTCLLFIYSYPKLCSQNGSLLFVYFVENISYTMSTVFRDLFSLLYVEGILLHMLKHVSSFITAPSQEKAANGTSMDPNLPPVPGCGDVNGQSPATNSSTSSTAAATSSTSNTPSTTTTPTTTTTQATTTTQSTSTTSPTITTSSTTTKRGSRQVGNGRYAVRVDKNGCLRKVLKSGKITYPASCLVRCRFYDKTLRDGRACLKVIQNPLQERQSDGKLKCWIGRCKYGVCVTTRSTQECEVPESGIFTPSPNPHAE